MSEKKEIEYYTALKFLELYNSKYGTSYQIKVHGDAPDFVCCDDSGTILNLETTLSEERPKDIKALLGRSDHLLIEKASFSKNGVRHSHDDVIPSIIDGIKKKLPKDYGKNTALVVRHASPIPWNYKWHIDKIKDSIAKLRNKYDKGIWLIDFEGNEIYRIL